MGVGTMPSEMADSLKRTNAIDAVLDDLQANEQKLLGEHLVAIDSFNAVVLVLLSTLASAGLVGETFAADAPR